MHISNAALSAAALTLAAVAGASNVFAQAGSAANYGSPWWELADKTYGYYEELSDERFRNDELRDDELYQYYEEPLLDASSAFAPGMPAGTLEWLEANETRQPRSRILYDHDYDDDWYDSELEYDWYDYDQVDLGDGYGELSP